MFLRIQRFPLLCPHSVWTAEIPAKTITVSKQCPLCESREWIVSQNSPLMCGLHSPSPSENSRGGWRQRLALPCQSETAFQKTKGGMMPAIYDLLTRESGREDFKSSCVLFRPRGCEHTVLEGEKEVLYQIDSQGLVKIALCCKVSSKRGTS